MTFQNTPAIALAAAAVSFFAMADVLAAATGAGETGTTITYTASGVFASQPTSGSDPLELAGERFTVTINVGSSTPPSQTGRNWALYSDLTLKGRVHSGLVGNAPVTIGSSSANIQQLIDPGQYDEFRMGAPLKVFSLHISIVADITLPAGTLSGPLLQTFNPVTLSPSDASFTYTYDGASTTLAIQSGTLTATSSGAPAADNAR